MDPQGIYNESPYVSSQHKFPYTSFPLYIHSRTPAITVSRIKTCIVTWMIPVEQPPRFEGTFFEPRKSWFSEKNGVYISNSSYRVSLQTQPFSTSVIMGERVIVDLVYELAELCIHPRCFFYFALKGR